MPNIFISINNDDNDDVNEDNDFFFRGMVNWQKAFNLISSQNHCQSRDWT